MEVDKTDLIYELAKPTPVYSFTMYDVIGESYDGIMD